MRNTISSTFLFVPLQQNVSCPILTKKSPDGTTFRKKHAFVLQPRLRRSLAQRPSSGGLPPLRDRKMGTRPAGAVNRLSFRDLGEPAEVARNPQMRSPPHFPSGRNLWGLTSLYRIFWVGFATWASSTLLRRCGTKCGKCDVRCAPYSEK